MSLKFGTDGVRAEAFTVLTTHYVAALGSAAAQVLGGGQWLIGRDTRESGPALAAAVAAGLAAGGAQPISVGVMPTPALAWLAARRGVPAAMITASHNPWQDNGVKFFAPGGLKLLDEVERAIEAVLQLDGPEPHDVVPSHVDALGEYVAHLVSLGGSLVGLRVVLDCANGAMSVAAPAVFRALGATVVVVHDRPDGRNINDRCGATHTASLAAAVVAELGNAVDGDQLIALAALQLRDEGRLHADTVVVTVMSNLGFHKAMVAAGIEVLTTAVGDRYVLEALDAHGHSVGGEQSGHIIYRDVATTGDGLLAGLRLAQFVHDGGHALAELAGGVMTSYPQVLVNVRVRERHPRVAAELSAEIEAAERSLGGDGRILVRASGTEPLIRVMVEAATVQQAQAVADELAAVVLGRFG